MVWIKVRARVKVGARVTVRVRVKVRAWDICLIEGVNVQEVIVLGNYQSLEVNVRWVIVLDTVTLYLVQCVIVCLC